MFKKTVIADIFVVTLSAFAMTSCSCSDSRKPEAKKEKEKDEVADAGVILPKTNLQQAVAEIKPFKDNKLTGNVTFTKVPDGIKIIADIEGLTPGEHGFHVHEFGDCSGPDGSAAGAHFNPAKSKHGGPDSPERHVGDLGNLVANEQGKAHYERTDHLIAFEGTNSIIGKSVIIHADRDDYTTQPTGASGAKIGCGIIKILSHP